MKCPFCHHLESKVTDSRNANEMNAIRRRRECLQCSQRFTTFETVDANIQVKKRNGNFEDFSIEKLISGIGAAARHTRVSHERVRTIANEIAVQLMEMQSKEIDTTKLGEIVMKRLQSIDTICYIRFACVYKRFKDVDELMDAIQTVGLEK